MSWVSASREHGRLAAQIANNIQFPHPDLVDLKGSPLESNRIRVSELDKCPRFLAYHWRGVPWTNPINAISREKMEKGNLIQDRVRGVLIPYYTDYWVVAWKPEPLLWFNCGDVILTGHPDGFLYDWKKGKLQSVFENKATSDYGFAQCGRENLSNPDHYSSTYVHQANTYAGMWNMANPKNPVGEFTIFVYNVGGKEDRDVGAPYKDFWFAHSVKLFQEDVHRAASLFRQVRDNPEFLPARPFDQTDWHCKGCSHYDHCYGIRRAVDSIGGFEGSCNVAAGQQSSPRGAVSRRPRAAAKGA